MKAPLNNVTISEGPPGGAPLSSEPAETLADAPVQVTKEQIFGLVTPSRTSLKYASFLNKFAKTASLDESKDGLRAAIRFETKRIRAIYRNFQTNLHFLHALTTDKSPMWQNRKTNIAKLTEIMNYQIAATIMAVQRISKLSQKLNNSL